MCSSLYDGQPNLGGECNCFGFTVFDRLLSKCVPMCENDGLAAGVLGWGSGCVCNSGASWDV